MEAVAAPCEQGAVPVVLDEQIDVDERGDPADEEKQFFGQPVCRGVDVALELADERRQFARRISQN